MNRVAASLASPDTDTCLKVLRELAPFIGVAEIRLDMMERYDLPRLITESPFPLILTCRPIREGGYFGGSESKRLNILAQAVTFGAAYIDVEWDSIDALWSAEDRHTRIIASRHWLDHMPSAFELCAVYDALCEKADVVKLVGMASTPQDILPILSLLHHATTPVIGLAMGEAGQLTRLLSICFQQCLLTYGSLTSTTATASGQLTVRQMIDEYHLNTVGPYTPVRIYVCQSAGDARRIAAKNGDANSECILYVPWLVSPEAAVALWPGVQAYLPRASLNAICGPE